MTDICVIVPTVREPECVRAYVENARDHGFDTERLRFLLVTEEFCDVAGMEAMLGDLGVDGEVFDGPRREAWFEARGLEEYADLIPAASHAETSFGLLYLWAGDYEYGFLIDDDTLPHDGYDFFGRHLRNLAFEGELESVASDERWVNVLYQNADEHGLYPRGYPYGAMDETVETEPVEVDDVVASQGLWTNVPDLDAVRILMDGDLQGQARTRTSAADFGNDFVAARGNYLTVCSMNLAFRREVVPAFYQLPMDDNEWGVGRFDDIWSGVFLKRACDVLGKRIYNGAPPCEHNKAPRSTFSDLHNEVAGLELNEHLWEIIDDVGPTDRRDGPAVESSERAELSRDDGRREAPSEPPRDGVGADADSYAGVFEAMGEALAEGEFEEYTNGAFLNHVGEAMLEWLDCLAAIEAGDRAVPEAEVTAD